MKTQFIQLYRMADVEVGAKLKLDGDAANKTMKEFKQEIKSANEELLNTQARFGATSKEALAAAKKVAILKDNIQDANETAKLFDPGNRFQAVGNAVRGLVGGFTALQGALALVGVEGDQVQKSLLKVQGALALTEGLNTIADVGKDFKRLGSTIVQTLGKSGLIGIAIAGVAALGLALSGVFSKNQSDSVKAYNETLKDYTKAAASARQTITEVKIAFEQAREGVISKEQALKIYNDTLGDSLGKTNDINKAEKILAEKAETYIKITALKAQANALFAKSAEQTAEALISQDELIKSGLGDANGLTGMAVKNAQKNIDKAIQGGKDIEALGTTLLRQAGQLSQSAGISTGTPTAATKATPGATTDPKEEQRKADLENEKRYRDEYNSIQYQAEQKRIADEKALRDAENSEKIDDSKYLNETILADNKSTQLINTDLLKVSATVNREIAEWEAAGRRQAAADIGNALGALADLIGKQTAAGKVLAIAQAVINTWLGVTEILRTKSVLPEPIATISRIANITAVVAAGLSAVRNIGKAQVPGASGGGVSIGGGTSAPLAPSVPQVTNTLLNQQQLNQIGNATTRAFVLETDVTNNQERVRRLNRAARL